MDNYQPPIFATIRQVHPPEHTNAGYTAMRDALLHGLPLHETLFREVQASSISRNNAALAGAFEFLLSVIDGYELTGRKLEMICEESASVTKALTLPGAARRSAMALIPDTEAYAAMVALCALVEEMNYQGGGVRFITEDHKGQKKVVNRAMVKPRNDQAETTKARAKSGGRTTAPRLRHGAVVKN